MLLQITTKNSLEIVSTRTVNTNKEIKMNRINMIWYFLNVFYVDLLLHGLDIPVKAAQIVFH